MKIQQNNEIENPENIDDHPQKEESEINQADFSPTFPRGDVAQLQLTLRNIQMGNDSPSSEVEKPANIDDPPLCGENPEDVNIHMNTLKTEGDAFGSEPEHPNPHLDEFVLTGIFQFAHDIKYAIEGNANSSDDDFEYNDFNLINAFTREHSQFKLLPNLHLFVLLQGVSSSTNQFVFKLTVTLNAKKNYQKYRFKILIPRMNTIAFSFKI
jgi:hypothetical protein